MKLTRLFVTTAILSVLVLTLGCEKKTENAPVPAPVEATTDAPATDEEPAAPTEALPAPAEDAPAQPADLPEELPAESTSTSAGGPGDTAPTAYASVETLEAQLTGYIETLEKKLTSDDAFEDKQGGIVRDTNTVIALAVVLGMHDQPNPYKGAASNIIAAAQKLAKATDEASTKAGVDALKASLKTTDGKSFGWDAPTASLAELMKQVPLIDGKLKSGLRRFKKTDEMAGMATTLAAIFQVSTANVAETEDATKSEEWVTFCLTSRDDAAALAVALTAADKKASQKNYDKLTQSCDECHAVFHKAALSK